jgi:hypothetical protein
VPGAITPQDHAAQVGVKWDVEADMSHDSKLPVLVTASLVSSLIMLDSNIVAVSLPSIGHALGASFTDIQWVISAYVLTYAALLLAAGDYADLRGRRPPAAGQLPPLVSRSNSSTLDAVNRRRSVLS